MTRLSRSCVLASLLSALNTPEVAAEPAAAHPLTGRIWDTRAQRYLAQDELEHRLRDARYVLLGEVHDNPVHHRQRRDLVAAVVRDGRRPVIAMEQFDREQQPALSQAQRESPRDAARIKAAGRFNDQGWNWPDYAPIVQLALDHDLPLVAANLSRAEAFRVATSGTVATLGEAAVTALGLDQPLPAAAQQKLERTIEEGHCGKAPRDILPGIVAAQRARDAVMAQALQQPATDGAVLVAGNGHVRRDFGVPQYLAADGVVVVGFLEVREGRAAPDNYYDSGSPEYDVIVYTPRTARADPCAGIRFKPRPANPVQPTAQP